MTERDAYVSRSATPGGKDSSNFASTGQQLQYEYWCERCPLNERGDTVLYVINISLPDSVTVLIMGQHEKDVRTTKLRPYRSRCGAFWPSLSSVGS